MRCAILTADEQQSDAGMMWQTQGKRAKAIFSALKQQSPLPGEIWRP
jgi:hypothetical protein